MWAWNNLKKAKECGMHVEGKASSHAEQKSTNDWVVGKEEEPEREGGGVVVVVYSTAGTVVCTVVCIALTAWL
jgi:hypothetical protein